MLSDSEATVKRRLQEYEISMSDSYTDADCSFCHIVTGMVGPVNVFTLKALSNGW